MVLCDPTGHRKFLEIFVHELQGLELPQMQSYNDVHTYAPTILGQLYFFRNQVLTL
jgi:hypothetical protein